MRRFLPTWKDLASLVVPARFLTEPEPPTVEEPAPATWFPTGQTVFRNDVTDVTFYSADDLQVPGERVVRFEGIDYPSTWTPEQAEQARARDREFFRQRREATARARALLMDVLSPEQQQDFLAHGSFEVRSGGRCFRIKHGRTHNIWEYAGDAVIATYCIVPQEEVPVEDQLVEQKLLLESTYLSYLDTVAVKTTVHRPTRGYDGGGRCGMEGCSWCYSWCYSWC